MFDESFFRFPTTPHLTWLGERQPRRDKVLTVQDAATLIAGDVLIEEKVDGANIGFSTTRSGELRIQNRGSYLERTGSHPQFRTLWEWVSGREPLLIDALWPDLMLFGEWCFATHAVYYDRLPDWFLGFDVYDRQSRTFWSTKRRNTLLRKVRLRAVPQLGEGHFTIKELAQFLPSPSKVGGEPIEGIVIRKESFGQTIARAKLVRIEFLQSLGEHWSRKKLRHNQLEAPKPLSRPKIKTGRG